MTTVVYTDGACSGNPGPGGWAWAVPGGRFASGADRHTTNQRMEINAALEAARALDGPLEIVSDSTYVINCFRDRWWEGWLKRGWTNSQKKPVANRDLWEPLIEIVNERKIAFRWVKGHSGDTMNDFVDQLAVEASKTQKPRSGDSGKGSMELLAGAGDGGEVGGVLEVLDAAALAAQQAGDAWQPSLAGNRQGDPEVPIGHLLFVTGAKPPELGGYEANPIATSTKLKLTDVLAAKAAMISGLKVVTGLSLGVEQLAAEVAVELEIPFVAVLPYPNQQAVWPRAAQDRYKILVDKADAEILLDARGPTSKQAAGAALNRRNAWLTRHVNEAVVIWDEKDPFLGRFIRSLQDHLGDTEVWVLPVPTQ